MNIKINLRRVENKFDQKRVKKSIFVMNRIYVFYCIFFITIEIEIKLYLRTIFFFKKNIV